MLTNYVFTALPPFILMGQLAFYTGLSSDAYDLARRWLGQLRGGLAVATIGGCALFSAVTGSPVACALTMVGVSLPEMQKAGYDNRLSTGSIATGSILGPMIPPSTVFIIYAFLTEVSLGYLFIAGIMPGIMLAILYMITIIIWVKISPQLAPVTEIKYTWRQRLLGFPTVWGIAILFILVLGGIYIGLFTPTEAGAIGAFGVFVVGLLKRTLGWKSFGEALREAGRTTGTILILFIGVYTFNAFLAITRIPFGLSDMITGLPVPPLGIMGVIMLMYIITGLFMDCMAVVFITVPLLYPTVIALGFDPLWFGVMIVLVSGLGAITPPYGIIIFAMSGLVKDIPMWTMFRGCFPFFFTNLIGIVILMFFPQIAYWLPYATAPG
jgi:tripartite ATP-independent transporter DctM subunit